ncbi:hypothetical protein [Geotalea sp. SG265]|uniref:hypothetical protein n=1 Tax=Geotalea sp. SG265 TaxID=2922867 RepID=UPI001FAFDE3C|nr:hypothetical protein [Geotalea sp. SG265]
MEQIPNPENTAATPQSTKRDWKEYASIAALAIALITAVASYYGRIYYGAYNLYWGLPADMFSLSKEQSVIGGIMAYILVFFKVLLDYVTIVFFIAVGLMFLAMLCCLRVIQRKLELAIKNVADWLQPKVVEHVHISDGIDRFVTRLWFFLMAISALIFSVPIMAVTYLWAGERGDELARQVHKEIISGKPSTKPFSSRATLLITNPSKGFDTYTGHLIQTSATHCALYQKGRGVMIFPLASVARMEIAENKANEKR